jgi:hypothetical protein
MEDFGKAKQDWFATFLPLPNGIPSDDTFTRVFSILDPTSFQDCFMRWTQSLREAITLIFEDRLEDMRRGLPEDAIETVVAV